MARRYEQYCPMAHALDLVGDRWALLVVRELTMLGAELGIVGGPRVQRVDELFRLLLYVKPGPFQVKPNQVRDPEQVGGHVGEHSLVPYPWITRTPIRSQRVWVSAGRAAPPAANSRTSPPSFLWIGQNSLRRAASGNRSASAIRPS